MTARIPAHFLLVATIVSALLLTGCGGEFVPASGVVNVDGVPASGATVIFHPTSGSTEKATGRADESGRYTLMTLTPGDGARPGEYVVTAVWLEESPAPGAEASNDPEQMTVAKDRLNGRYAAEGSASPKVTVPADGSELPPIDLKTK